MKAIRLVLYLTADNPFEAMEAIEEAFANDIVAGFFKENAGASIDDWTLST